MNQIKKIVFLLLCSTLCISGQGLAFTDSVDYELAAKKQLFSDLNIASLPVRVDLSTYVPTVMSQGQFGTCVGVSVGYYMRTMLEAIRLNITEKSEIDKLRYSPSYLYNAIKNETGNECQVGTEISRAFQHLRDTGIVGYDVQPYPSCQKNEGLTPTDGSKILDFVTVFSLIKYPENKVNLTKKALAENAPVVVGIQTTPSIDDLGFWESIWLRILKFLNINTDAEIGLWRPEKSGQLRGGHAICLTGYDDDKFGGAFQAVNSRGKKWGDKGFFWIRYQDFVKHAKYGYQAFLPSESSKGEVEMGGELLIELTENPIGEVIPFVKKDNAYPVYVLRKPQPTGTRYKIRVNLSEQAYVYLLTESSVEKFTTKLFPEGFASTPPIGRNTIVQLPSERQPFTLAGSTGTEYFLALFSTVEITDINLYIRKIRNGNGMFIQRVKTAFGDKLIPEDQIIFSSEKMSFRLKGGHSGNIVPLTVSLKHVRRTVF